MSARFRPFPTASGAVAVAGLLLAGFGVPSGCDEAALGGGAPAASASAAAGGLTPELASRVLARVGDRTITLGEFAATVDRMDDFERLRYQSPDRRKELLSDMIKVELLAEEARRRGLDREPETIERIRQLLRDELLRQARAAVPAATDIPESEVRAYYEKHKDAFREPARRRVSVIVLADDAAAKAVLEQAKTATAMQWGKLVERYSLNAPPKAGPTSPVELFGDVGIVNAPGAKDTNPAVPTEVRQAVFEIEKVGGVYPSLVKSGGKAYVVRMTSQSDARERSLAEAERTIRVAIVQERITDAEARLEAELRRRFPIKIDDAALQRITLPAPRPPPSADGPH